MVPVIVILVLLLTLAFFYLKCSMMQSFLTLWSAILATIIAFSSYEFAAELLISRGFGLDWALLLCFTVVFVVIFAVLYSVSDFLIGIDINLGNVAKLSTALICGLLTGLIISGNLLVALGLLPMHGKVFYSRFDPAPDATVAAEAPKAPALGADGLVTALYNQISAGSMSSGKSFGVLHADYLSQIHLNKLKVKDQVLSVCSRKAIEIPSKKDLHPVRTWTSSDNGEFVVVRMGIRAKKIEDGGANNNSAKVTFFPAQIRLIVKEANATEKSLAGTATALYPEGLWKNGGVVKWKLNDIITPDSKEIKDKVYWMDVVFQCPKDEKPILLQFKQTAVVDLTPYEVVKNTPEIERDLDNEGQKEESP